jgi:hypothetical protein
LRPGDRIDVATPNNGANQISANGVATTVQLDAVNGDTLVVHNVRHPDQPNPSYTLILRPDTIFTGTADLQVGDQIYYTGWAASPDGAYTGQSVKPGIDSTVDAARVFPQEIAAPPAPEQPLAPAPDIIGACPPEQPLPETATEDVPVDARRAAVKYALTTLQWPSVQVVRAYHVGSGDTSYESMYRTQITQSCGGAVADASFGVNLSDPDGDSSTSTRAALVVAQFADGWHVWARFYN